MKKSFLNLRPKVRRIEGFITYLNLRLKAGMIERFIEVKTESFIEVVPQPGCPKGPADILS